jgi:hypothetical protein
MEKSFFIATKCFLKTSFMAPQLPMDPTGNVRDPENWHSSSNELLVVSPHVASKYARCSLASPIPSN